MPELLLLNKFAANHLKMLVSVLKEAKIFFVETTAIKDKQRKKQKFIKKIIS